MTAISMLATLVSPDKAWADRALAISLGECGAIFDILAQAASERAEEQAERMGIAAGLFFDEAYGEAENSGGLDPIGWMTDEEERLRDKWGNRLLDPALTDENRVWVTDCLVLGREQGVLPIID
ncbi:MAG: hypothetical protein AAF675_05980 [Pseudomonadota bacterium]